MTPEAAANLIKLLKSTPVPYDGGGWVKAPCPLARWTHQSHKDSNPSFGISTKPGERSRFHCFACASGSLTDLVGALTMNLQRYAPDSIKLYPLKQIFQMVEEEEMLVLPLPDYEEENSNPYADFQEWPEYFIESFAPWNMSKDCVEYLKKRNVTKDQAIKHNLRWDADKRRVIFPYRSVYDKLSGARGRAVDDVEFKHYDYTWNGVNNAGLVWYNEEVFNNEQPIVVVEGQFDCLAVERCYPNVIANLTAKPSPFKMKRLQSAEGLVFMTDNDKAGRQAMEKYIAYAQQHKLDFYPLYLPQEQDEQGNLIKLDPDKLGTDWIRTKLEEIGLL